MDWQFTTDRPIYLQIVEQISHGILAGIYPPGSVMPSVRALAIEAEVNPNTMQKALAELERQSLLHAQRTSGRIVTTDEGLIMALKQNLAQGFIEQFFANMQNLGIQRDEALQILQSYDSEAKPGRKIAQIPESEVAK